MKPGATLQRARWPQPGAMATGQCPKGPSRPITDPDPSHGAHPRWSSTLGCHLLQSLRPVAAGHDVPLQPPCPAPAQAPGLRRPMTIQKRRRLTPVHPEPPRSWAGPGGRGPSTPHSASSHLRAFPGWPTSLFPPVAGAPPPSGGPWLHHAACVSLSFQQFPDHIPLAASVLVEKV